MSKGKIYLSPSNQISNVGAYEKTNEHEQCQKIAEVAKKQLEESYECEVFIAKQSEDMKARAKSAKNSNAEVYVAIHTNAFSDKKVSGTETYYHSSDANGKRLANELLKAISALTGVKRRTKSYDGLTELNSVDCTRAYVEVEFHSNPDKAKWIVENTGEIGKAIAETVASFMKLDKKAEPAPPEKEEKPAERDARQWIIDNIDLVLSVIADKIKSI